MLIAFPYLDFPRLDNRFKKKKKKKKKKKIWKKIMKIITRMYPGFCSRGHITKKASKIYLYSFVLRFYEPDKNFDGGSNPIPPLWTLGTPLDPKYVYRLWNLQTFRCANIAIATEPSWNWTPGDWTTVIKTPCNWTTVQLNYRATEPPCNWTPVQLNPCVTKPHLTDPSCNSAPVQLNPI